ncbi:hypothetical protein D3C84_1290210 [compost metagenome]
MVDDPQVATCSGPHERRKATPVGSIRLGACGKQLGHPRQLPKFRCLEKVIVRGGLSSGRRLGQKKTDE